MARPPRKIPQLPLANTVSNTDYVVIEKRSGNNSVTSKIAFSDFKDFGNPGYTGSVGYTGSQGVIGYTGSVGYVGSSGTVVDTLQELTGTSITIDPANGTMVSITTTANTIITLPAASSGRNYTVIIKYGADDGITWSSSDLRWESNIEPTPSSNTNVIDTFVFFSDGVYTYGGLSGRY